MAGDEVDMALADLVELEQAVGDVLLGDTLQGRDGDRGVLLLVARPPAQDDGGLPLVQLVLGRQFRRLARVFKTTRNFSGASVW
jgi:hypothetical protein